MFNLNLHKLNIIQNECIKLHAEYNDLGILVLSSLYLLSLCYGPKAGDIFKNEFKQKFKNYTSVTFLDQLIPGNTNSLAFQGRAELIHSYCKERLLGSQEVDLCTITILTTTYESGLNHDEHMWNYSENSSWWAMQGKRGIDKRIPWEEFNYKLSVTLPKLKYQKGQNFQKALQQFMQILDVDDIGDIEDGAVQISDSDISKVCNPKTDSEKEETACQSVIRSMIIEKRISFPFASNVQEKFKTTPEWSNRMNAIIKAEMNADMLISEYLFKDVLKLTEIGIGVIQNTEAQDEVLKNCNYVESVYHDITEEINEIVRNWCNHTDSIGKIIKHCKQEMTNLIADRVVIINEIKKSTVGNMWTIERLKKVKAKSEIICHISGHYKKECLTFIDKIFLENKFVNMENIIMTAFISRGTSYTFDEIREKLENVNISTNEYADIERATSLLKEILKTDEARPFSQQLHSTRINEILQTRYHNENQTDNEVNVSFNSKY